ncbi:MAG: DNA-binding protein [Nitrospirae bacterium]|nr:DNA-binding protein [Nitrospirota bacterium]
MKKRFVLFAAVIAGCWIMSGPVSAFERTGVVATTMTKGIYTYLEVETPSGRYWAAAPKMDLAVGDRVDVAPGSEMRDFFAPSLNRKFDSIIFTSSVKVIGHGAPPAKAPSSKSPEAKKGAGPADLKTVEQIYTERSDLKGKQVQVRGKVVKVSPGILGKTFFHIQDGSGKDGTNDLAVTTKDAVRVGDKVVASGTIDTDKDLGAGYTYKVILEEATIKSE